MSSPTVGASLNAGMQKYSTNSWRVRGDANRKARGAAGTLATLRGTLPHLESYPRARLAFSQGAMGTSLAGAAGSGYRAARKSPRADLP